MKNTQNIYCIILKKVMDAVWESVNVSYSNILIFKLKPQRVIFNVFIASLKTKFKIYG